MPLTSSGKKVLGSMKDKYGEKKGESVFYATANKNKKLGAKWHGAGDRNHAASAGGVGAGPTTPGIQHVAGTRNGTRPGEGPVAHSEGGRLGGSGGSTPSVKSSAGALPSAGYSKQAPGNKPTPGVHHGQGVSKTQTPYASKSKIGHSASQGGAHLASGGLSGGKPASHGLKGGLPAGGADRSKPQQAAFTDGLSFQPVQGGGSPFGDEATRRNIASRYTARG